MHSQRQLPESSHHNFVDALSRLRNIQMFIMAIDWSLSSDRHKSLNNGRVHSWVSNRQAKNRFSQMDELVLFSFLPFRFFVCLHGFSSINHFTKSHAINFDRNMMEQFCKRAETMTITATATAAELKIRSNSYAIFAIVVCQQQLPLQHICLEIVKTRIQAPLDKKSAGTWSRTCGWSKKESQLKRFYLDHF